MKHEPTLIRVASTVALVLFSAVAVALPSVGDSRPDASISDAWSRTLALSKFGEKPVLVIYEDKDSSAQNQALKDELAKLAKGDRYKSMIGLVAVADLTGFDYWPVRGFVKDSIRKESKKQGTAIMCDWNGSFGRALGLSPKKSNVVLYGKNGRVRLAHAGAMSEEKRHALIAMLREEVGELPTAPSLFSEARIRGAG